jgi:uncharacterized repeat protein (TIGR03803 family)
MANYSTTIEEATHAPADVARFFSLKSPASCLTRACPWTETVLYRFHGNIDGFYPAGGLAFGLAGNIYGMTIRGGSVGRGTVYELKRSSGREEKYSLQSYRRIRRGQPI